MQKQHYNLLCHSKYIRGIDGLRALAILAVILYHLNPSILPSGFSGVDIFFVISGYVVSSSLSRKFTPNFLRFAIDFYSRRIIRIFPALVVCLAIVTAATTLFVPSTWLNDSINNTALKAFFGISNFALLLNNNDYFSPIERLNPFLHTWSLGVEEQFYLIFPLICFVWLKYKERKDVVGRIGSWLLVGLLIISICYSWFETSASPEKTFYLLPGRFWELAFGSLVFMLHSQQKLIPVSSLTTKLYLAIGATLVVLGFIFANGKQFPFPWALLSVSGSVLLISGVVNKSDKKPIIQKLLENSIVVYIGKISYSLYLWHWPVFVIFRWTIGLETMLKMGFAVILTVFLAAISYHYIETPIRKNKFILARPTWQTVLAGIAVVIISYNFSGVILKAQPNLSLSVTKDEQTWYPYPRKTKVNQSLYINRKLFVLGDSHVSSHGTMLQQLSDEFGINVLTVAKGGCGVANLLYPIMDNEPCRKFIEKAILDISVLAAPGDILFLPSLRMYRLGDNWETIPEEEVVASQSNDEESSIEMLALNEAEELIRKFEKLPIHIVIDAPKPVFKSPPFRCSDWFNKSNPICASGFSLDRDFLLERRRSVMNSLDVLKSAHPKLIIWDPFPILCEADTCSAFDDNKPLYYDGDHLSAYGNHILYPSFRSLILKICFPNHMVQNI